MHTNNENKNSSCRVLIVHVNFYDSREKVSGMDLAEIVVLSSVAAEWVTSRIIPQKMAT